MYKDPCDYRVRSLQDVIDKGAKLEAKVKRVIQEFTNGLYSKRNDQRIISASMVTLALLRLEVEGPTIVHTDKLQGIMSSEKKITFDKSNMHISSIGRPLDDIEKVSNNARELI
jgi:hypothetical protein